jgi:hypothetical protein
LPRFLLSSDWLRKTMSFPVSVPCCAFDVACLLISTFYRPYWNWLRKTQLSTQDGGTSYSLPVMDSRARTIPQRVRLDSSWAEECAMIYLPLADTTEDLSRNSRKRTICDGDLSPSYSSPSSLSDLSGLYVIEPMNCSWSAISLW